MAQTINGSVEILIDGGRQSVGLILEVRDVADIPEALRLSRALDDLAPIEDLGERDDLGGIDLAWTATTSGGEAAEVLWRAWPEESQ